MGSPILWFPVSMAPWTTVGSYGHWDIIRNLLRQWVSLALHHLLNRAEPKKAHVRLVSPKGREDGIQQQWLLYLLPHHHHPRKDLTAKSQPKIWLAPLGGIFMALKPRTSVPSLSGAANILSRYSQYQQWWYTSTASTTKLRIGLLIRFFKGLDKSIAYQRPNKVQ